ncbi:flagellar motor protein MotB [Nibricoccus aquaticus]|uniref:Flagellar motor protein MotB n=1 Tax=Nibricoccus aquaticus TaxID=2576891 RepID=A0A290Q4P6_9BACT|nr:flagellar motor protein MotB [Nibricoccus aquaticus]ATC63649.1 flagellar motor protein MotB [Nibricoccus aquaticus]
MAGKGGAWKVAYADFVTAMMALFMVLWICSQDKEVLIATSEYFQNPFNSPMKASSGVMPFDSKASKSNASGEGKDDSSNAVNLQFLNSIAKDFFRMMQLDEDLADKPIDIQVTSDGLRVNLFDRARQPIFQKNTAEFTEWGRFVMQSLAWMIDRNRFHVVIEGHTRPGLDLPKPEYTPWELSADRANASRRALTHYAVDDEQIDRVTGYAATRPLPDQPKDSEAQQRVTLSLTVGRTKEKDTEKPAKPGTATPKPATPAAAPRAPATTTIGSARTPAPTPGLAGSH